MNILSLFDGISCGQIALERANIKVDNYYASEIDKYAIQIAKKNYPDTIHIGNVVDVKANDLPKIDLLIGGSPCQSFSFAGKRKGMSTKCDIEILSLEQYLELKNEGFEFKGQSYLFWEYIRLLKEVKPKYFLLENVVMSKKWENILSSAIGVEPIMINGSLLSAQNRKRLYWTNIPNVEQPEDKGILLRDILESSEIQKDYIETKILIDNIKPSVAKNIIEQHKEIKAGKNGFYQLKCSSGFQDNKIGITKTPSLRAGNSSTYVKAGSFYYRKLTPLECERLQTLPEKFTEGVSNSQRFKMIGNGWTVDVIAHIFKSLK